MLVAVLLSSLATGTVALILGAKQRQESERRDRIAQQESDQRWCALLGDLDDAYQGPPRPTTALGRKVAEEIHRLRVGFGCPER